MPEGIQNIHLIALHEQGFEVYERRRQTPDSFKEQLGFQKFYPRIFRKWAHTVGEAEATKVMQVWGDTLYGRLGCYLVFDPTVNPEKQYGGINDFDHWPVDPQEFAMTYTLFPMPNFPYELTDESQGKVGDAYLSPVEFSMVKSGWGFFPVYKSAPIWAKVVKTPTAILGLEHNDEPTLLEMGAVLALGISGEPYAMKLEKFHRLYIGEIS